MKDYVPNICKNMRKGNVILSKTKFILTACLNFIIIFISRSQLEPFPP
jgi:hypothetical protein